MGFFKKRDGTEAKDHGATFFAPTEPEPPAASAAAAAAAITPEPDRPRQPDQPRPAAATFLDGWHEVPMQPLSTHLTIRPLHVIDAELATKREEQQRRASAGFERFIALVTKR